jgi:hypothetical protein
MSSQNFLCFSYLIKIIFCESKFTKLIAIITFQQSLHLISLRIRYFNIELKNILVIISQLTFTFELDAVILS